MLDTQTYQRDCLRMFGHYLHHAPSFGNDTDEKAEMVQQQQDMLQLYSNEFGESAGRDMWPMTPSDPSSDEKMPDCCSVRQPTFFFFFWIGSLALPRVSLAYLCSPVVENNRRTPTPCQCFIKKQ